MTPEQKIIQMKRISNDFAFAVEKGGDIPTEYHKAKMALEELKKLSTETNKETK